MYYASTGLISLQMLATGFANLFRVEEAMRTIRLLGYPEYFPVVLGVAKLAGVIALWLRPRWKITEWAYAGFCFDFIAAAISHLAVKNYTVELIASLISLSLLAVSYYTYQKRATVATPARA